MALLCQIHHGAVGLLLISNGDGGVFCGIQGPIGIGIGAADKGNIEQGRIRRAVIRPAAEENDALQALFPLHHGAALDLVLAGANLPHDHGTIRRIQIPLNGTDNAGIKGVLHAAYHQADGI